jgi:hypothetical protein
MRLGLGLGLIYSGELVDNSWAEPEIYRYFNGIGIPYDATIIFPSTPQEITGEELWIGLDTAVKDIKTALGLPLGGNNLQTKFKYIYPSIGDTSSQMRYNLVTGTPDGTFFGGWSFDPSGITPNGTNAYFQSTYKYDLATFNRNDQSFAFLSKTNSDVFYTDFGAAGFGFGNLTVRARYSGIINTECAIMGGITNSISDSLGLIGVNRTNSANYKVIKNGTVVATHTAASVDLPGTGGFIVNGANNNNNTIIQYSPRKRTWFYGGAGMTDLQIADIYASIATFETLLNR